MIELADVVRLHGPAYREKYGSRMLPSHRRALDDILACRTPAMGGHVFECDCCGLLRHAYHSCKNRSCPKCHTNDTEQWIRKRQGELIGVPYFHAVLTIPSGLRQAARTNQSLFYSLLMSSAAQALMTLCADPRYLGGTIGVMAVLHTWSRTLGHHPHVHCLVPAVAVRGGECVAAPRDNFLVPVGALSVLMRGILLDRLRRHMPEFKIPRAVRRAKWRVYIKPPIHDAHKVLTYLGRYVHRIAISNSRIVGLDAKSVTFRYQPSNEVKWKTMTLTGEEFLRRYLQHVLPRGFHKVRYYGLWAPANRHLLRQVQLQFPHVQTSPADDLPEPDTSAQLPKQCPRCMHGTLRLIATLFRQPRTRRHHHQRGPP